MTSARIWWLALLSLNAHLSYEWCGVMKFSTIARWSWEPEEPAKDFDRVGCMFLHPNMLHKFACKLWSSVRSTAPSEKHLRIRKVHTSSMERFVRSISRYFKWSLKPCWVERTRFFFCRLQSDAAVAITSSRSMRLSSYDADGDIAVAAVLDFQRFLEN